MNAICKPVHDPPLEASDAQASMPFADDHLVHYLEVVRPLPAPRLADRCQEYRVLKGERAASQQLRLLEGQLRRRARMRARRSGQREIELRKNKFRERIVNEPEHNDLHWSWAQAFRLHLALLERSLEQLRASRPGCTIHTEVCIWIDRNDPFREVPLSFDTCARLWGVSPDGMRERIDAVRRLDALSPTRLDDFVRRLSAKRWQLICEADAVGPLPRGVR